MKGILNAILAPFGLCRCVGWMNIYKSGYFHRAGKPGMYDRHPGDLYPTRESALADVDPRAAHLYMTTVKVVWYEDRPPHVNCVNSVPVPVAESRRKLAKQPDGFYQDGLWRGPPPPLTQGEIEQQIWLANAGMLW